jgi:hypothetical protein
MDVAGLEFQFGEPVFDLLLSGLQIILANPWDLITLLIQEGLSIRVLDLAVVGLPPGLVAQVGVGCRYILGVLDDLFHVGG